ncbi:ABC transporter permease subunit [Sansalvadorimonas sp. 2012CJ34-2]|uniref:ABC transporter permease subunit n=1 Tax=Parendozoicomonas callyspongiae TaxID=2942213 RepID=A0ABT0PJ82_9GAMM|nr:ABC transporter permease subunit [Sansalvadorimonas sp. 2012CJ34-2]MCL6270802.1 ABC transporter permease subunit [Sansalvadorimonas sp. 2012CJ34-2]
MQLIVRFSGWLALLGVSLVTLLSFYGLIGFSDQGPDWQLFSDSYFYSILSFSIQQAFLSALFSVLLAWPVARAIYYQPNLPGVKAFLSLCLLCFVMPTLVLITGLVALLGGNGLVTPAFELLLGEGWDIYGLGGILLAHTYLNMPFAIRIFYQQLNAIPDSSWQLASQLKLTPWQRFRIVEWSSLSGQALTLFGFIFVLCFNSFAIVLALGGGPQSTTLEVAIYQALKYDFNIPEALMLAWAQLLIAGGFFMLVSRLGKANWLSVDTASRLWTPNAKGYRGRMMQLTYLVAWVCLVLPMVALLVGVTDTDQSLKLAELLVPTVTSLGLGLFSATLGVVMAWVMLNPARELNRRGATRQQLVVEWIASHGLVAPAMVVSVGLFIFLLQHIDIDRWGMPVVALLNTFVVIPFAIQKLKPRLLQFDAQYYDLCRSLKVSGFALWKIQWPFVRPVFLTTFALLFVLAIGDVAIFSIFGNQSWQTLPWLIYGYAGSYRIAEASIASLLLLGICSLILWGFEKAQMEQKNV